MSFRASPFIPLLMLIDERYFTYPSTFIAGIEVSSDGKPAGPAIKLISDIKAYIAQYEPCFLRMLLGSKVSRNIEKYPSIISLLAQVDKGTSVIAKYVYFYYSRDHITFNTVAGEKIKNTENSSNASPRTRLVWLWNNMVDECWYIVNSIEDVEICPDFESEIFEKINSFNL